jgi:multidrug efflux pump subunit AcrA (membrane-fusion protein)
VTTAQNALTTAQNTLSNGNLDRGIQNANLGLQVAQQTLTDTQAGAKQSDLDAAQRSIDAAQSSVDSAQAKYDALFDPPKPETILPLQASVDSAKAALSTAQVNLVAATITAPFDGQISSLSGEVGSQVSASTAVFILLNPKLIRVDANVDQSDISNLKVGQNATITFDALTGRAYQGTVSAIGLTPTTTQGVVTYVVSFAIDTGQLPATTPIPAPGMTGSISVLTSSTPNAIVVPTRAIKRVGRAATVTLKTASGTIEENHAIQIGSASGNLTQVTSGLSEGDLVLVSTGSTATAAPATTNRTTNTFGGGGGGGAGGFQIPAGGR